MARRRGLAAVISVVTGLGLLAGCASGSTPSHARTPATGSSIPSVPMITRVTPPPTSTPPTSVPGGYNGGSGNIG